MTPLPPGLQDNRLLALLDAGTLQALAPALEPFPLPPRITLWREQEPMAHAYFPVEGVLSVLCSGSAAEPSIEVATIGREGVLGVPLVLGAELSPNLVFAQVAGAAWRMEAEAFRAAVRSLPALAQVLHRYTQALMVQMSQGTACNRLHPALQRCARWLLQTHDRVRGDAFDLTQDFLAQMVGERRATVNQVAGELQQQGLIRYTRGRIVVTDRAGLEATACPCYRKVRLEYARMLGEGALD